MLCVAGARIDLLTERMEEVSEELMDGLDLLFASNFVESHLVWPHAELQWYSDYSLY